MIRWLAQNVGLIVLSLILATIVWIVAAMEADPVRERTFLQVPLQVTNLPEPMRILDQSAETVQVRLRAPDSILRTIEPATIRAWVDAKGLMPGTHTLPVQAELPPEVPAKLISISPAQVVLQVDEERTRTLTVTVRLIGEPALGYRAQRPIVSPKTVTIRGPASQVDRVKTAMVQVSLRGTRSSVEQTLTVLLRDAEGKPVSGVALSPERVHVSIPVEQLGNYRDLAVKVRLEGDPAPGYWISQVSTEPQLVTVFAAPGLIDQLPGFLETLTVTVEGASDDIVERVALDVPPNVTVVVPSEPSVQVQIRVEALQASKRLTVKPTVQGLTPGLVPVLSPQSVDLILSGPQPRLETLTPDMIRLVLDLSGLVTGTHQLEPQPVVPEGLTVVSILPASIQVELLPEPPVTPTPTLTGTLPVTPTIITPTVPVTPTTEP